MNDKIEDRIVLCDNPKCAVRSLWAGKIENMRCPQCNGSLKVDPMLGHLDESQDLLDEALDYLKSIDYMTSNTNDLIHRIAKHLGGNR
jgi:hypothetical protein